MTVLSGCILGLVTVLIPSPASAQSSEELETRGFAALREESYREALADFEELLSLEPDRPSAHFGKAEALTGLLDYGEAARSLEETVRLDPDHAKAWRRLVILYGQLGQRKSALEAYQKARALEKTPKEERLPLLRALRKAGFWAEAREVLDNAPPATLTVGEHLEAGILAIEDADYARAAEHLREATAAPERSSAEAEYHYGRALEALGQPEDAIGHYRLAVVKDPQLRSARFRLGSLLLRTGNAEEGRELLHDYEQFRERDRMRKLLLSMVSSGKLSPVEEREKRLKLANLLIGDGELEEAETFIRTALRENPDDAAFRTAEARRLVALDELQKARAMLEPVVSSSSPFTEALWLLARIEFMERRFEEAVAMFERYAELEPEPSAQFWKELATSYAMLGEDEQAETFFHRAIEQDPSFAEAHADLGLLLESAGRREEAEASYRRALASDSGLVSAQLGLAGLLMQKGEGEEALELVERGVALRPRAPELRRTLARALQELGRIEEAKTELSKARALESRNSAPPR